MEKPLDLPRATRLIAGAVGGLFAISLIYTVWISRVATRSWWEMLATTFLGGFTWLVIFAAGTIISAYLLSGLVPADAMSGWGRLLAGASIPAVLTATIITGLSPNWGPIPAILVFGITLTTISFARVGESIFQKSPRWVPICMITAGIALALVGVINTLSIAS